MKKAEHYIKHKNLFSHIKMDKEISKFDDIEIENHNFTDIKILFFKKKM